MSSSGSVVSYLSYPDVCNSNVVTSCDRYVTAEKFYQLLHSGDVSFMRSLKRHFISRRDDYASKSGDGDRIALLGDVFPGQ